MLLGSHHLYPDQRQGFSCAGAPRASAQAGACMLQLSWGSRTAAPWGRRPLFAAHAPRGTAFCARGHPAHRRPRSCSAAAAAEGQASAAAAAEADAAATSEAAAGAAAVFDELLAAAAAAGGGSGAAAASCAVRLGPSAHGNGLFFTRDVARGEVVLSVPLSACLLVDYQSGLQVGFACLSCGA